MGAVVAGREKEPQLPGSLQAWITATVFAVTYLGLALGRIPKLRIDRAGIAFAGAALMLCTGIVTLAQAASPESIDYETLALLFGMMIVVGFLRLSGFFNRLTHWLLDRIQSPYGLLAVVILLAGILSSFLVNDIVCLALTPLVLRITKRLNLNPLPQLIGLATAANIGSTGTITGNPQNIIIGVRSRISYLTFAAHLMPVALLGLVIDFLVVSLTYHSALAGKRGNCEVAKAGESDVRAGRRSVLVRLQWKSAVVALLVVLLFFAGLPMAVVAVGAAAFLLMDRVKPERVYREVDWSLLLMFAGLFIVVHAFQLRVVNRWGMDGWGFLARHPISLLSLTSAGLSNLVSNVPAVLLFEPALGAMPGPTRPSAWLALAMSSTLAGNLTILGSVANLIVVEKAKRDGVVISFWEYCRVGVPVTLLTLALGIAWLIFVRY